MVSDEEISMNRYWDGMDSDGKPGPGGVLCIGVKCMAWRWSDKNAALGYCGLAGPPE